MKDNIEKFARDAGTSVVKRSGALRELEKRLQELFRNEIRSILEMGQILSVIKRFKLYRYKTSDRDCTWKEWASEFFGSQDTATRYLQTAEYFKDYEWEELKDIPLTYLYFISQSGRDDTEFLLKVAKNAPNIQELKATIRQKPYTIEEITAGHDCSWEEIHFFRCSICGKTERPRNLAELQKGKEEDLNGK